MSMPGTPRDASVPLAFSERIAILSDEAAPGFAEAVRICLPLGIRAYELRGLGGGRVPYVPAATLDEVVEQVGAHGLTLLGISPGFARCNVADPTVEVELTTGLDAAFALLDRLKTRRITIFSYLRTARGLPIPAAVFDQLGMAVARCRQVGAELLIENSAACWADTGEHLAELASGLHVGVTWDPANAQASGEKAFPDGYNYVRALIAHVHCKNWLPGAGCVDILAGDVDMSGQIAALQAAGYRGYYCVEPHQWDNRAAAARTNAAQLARLLAERDGSTT